MITQKKVPALLAVVVVVVAEYLVVVVWIIVIAITITAALAVVVAVVVALAIVVALAVVVAVAVAVALAVAVAVALAGIVAVAVAVVVAVAVGVVVLYYVPAILRGNDCRYFHIHVSPIYSYPQWLDHRSPRHLTSSLSSWHGPQLPIRIVASRLNSKLLNIHYVIYLCKL